MKTKVQRLCTALGATAALILFNGLPALAEEATAEPSLPTDSISESATPESEAVPTATAPPIAPTAVTTVKAGEPTAPAEYSPELEVVPNVVLPESPVTLKGKGFAPNIPAIVYLINKATEDILGFFEHPVDENGSFTVTGLLSPTELGKYLVDAGQDICSYSGTGENRMMSLSPSLPPEEEECTVSALAEFEVVDELPPPPTKPPTIPPTKPTATTPAAPAATTPTANPVALAQTGGFLVPFGISSLVLVGLGASLRGRKA